MHNHYLYTPMLKLNLYLRLSKMFSIANKNRINIIIYCNKGSLKLVSCLFLEFSETMESIEWDAVGCIFLSALES